PATTLLSPPDDGLFGASVTGAGDLNGDGLYDVAIGAFGFNESTGRVYAYHGGVGLAAGPATTLTGPAGMQGLFGASIASADPPMCQDGNPYGVVLSLRAVGSVTRPAKSIVSVGLSQMKNTNG